MRRYHLKFRDAVLPGHLRGVRVFEVRSSEQVLRESRRGDGAAAQACRRDLRAFVRATRG